VSRVPIALRLALAGTLALALILPLGGYLMQRAFATAVRTAFDERLNALVRVLVATTEVDASGSWSLARPLGDPRFEQVFSGWYWQIANDDGILLVSRSLWDGRLPTLPPDTAAGPLVHDGPGPRGESVRIAEMDVTFPGQSRPVHIAVAASVAEIEEEVREFTGLLALGLAGLGVLLIAVVVAQVRWGLAPLRRIRADLAAVRRGDAEALPTDLPPELSELAREINQVLAHDRTVIERSRTTAGNLAHALKTPLAVLRVRQVELPAPAAHMIGAEVDRIQQAVDHHLSRAASEARAVYAARVSVAEALAPVVQAIRASARDRALELSSDIDPALSVRVAAQDLQQIAGNLLENAVAFTHGRIALEARPQAEGWMLSVDDDGSGVSPGDAARAIERGGRLDASTPGWGLGLAIVGDLTRLYDGELSLERSPLGGLRACVSFPKR
jgi:signal transduction histidine kinase